MLMQFSFASAAWISSTSSPYLHHRHNCRAFLPIAQTRWQQSNLYSSKSPGKPIEHEMKRDVLKIINEAIRAVDPYSAVKSHFRMLDDTSLEIGTQKTGTTRINLNEYDKILVVSFGKASAAMATAVVQQLQGSKLLESNIAGAVICKDGHATTAEQSTLSNLGIGTFMASHPVPDERSTKAAEYALNLVKSHASLTSLVICCISGGGSALFCKPRENLTLQDLQDVNSALLASGMGIQDCNIVRKRLEDGKGGRLAAQCHPSQVVTLVLSDGTLKYQNNKYGFFKVFLYDLIFTISTLCSAG
jgi:glycerate-2-kinase